MASPTTSVLTREQIAEQLGTMPGWQLQGSELAKTYRFKNFLEAVDFVNKIAREAEAAGHHPDLLVRWGEVTVQLTTHSAGGVTESDLKLAKKIDQI
jgi:4a-hydroxytetrahydrobiopterin dehydratase